MDSSKLRAAIANAILDKPYEFRVGSQPLHIYPITLGQHLMTISILEKVGLDIDQVTGNAIDMAMCMAKAHREDSLKLLAVNMMQASEIVNKPSSIDKYAKELGEYLDAGDVATLIIAVITYSQDKINFIIKESDLQHDRNDMQRISNAKKGKNSFTFGGRTIYGKLIDAACDRYGWTLDYVLWGISYINLNMMITDQINSVYLSDQELKHAHITNDREILNGDNPENMKKIMEQFKD